MKIGFIGAGRVGCSIGKYLKESGLHIAGYYDTIKDYGRINGDSGNIFDFPNYCQPILIDYLVKKLELSKF